MSKRSALHKDVDPVGIIIGMVMIVIWFVSLLALLNWKLSFSNPWVYVGVFWQTHLFTGLFITAHDAMHGSISKNKKWNYWLGWITSMLFAFNFYDRLLVKHHEHHRFVASEHDPDYHESGNFWLWYWTFIKKYTTLKQLILMTISLQLLRFVFPIENLLLFWILPGILSTFQLFYFGTYIPHKDGHEHDNKHKSKTLKKNHILAFFSCYFFGYHYEHHDAPGVPWWRLWQLK